jgi:hypothetical protein
LFSFPAPLEVFQLPPCQRKWEVHLLAFFIILQWPWQ